MYVCMYVCISLVTSASEPERDVFSFLCSSNKSSSCIFSHLELTKGRVGITIIKPRGNESMDDCFRGYRGPKRSAQTRDKARRAKYNYYLKFCFHLVE